MEKVNDRTRNTKTWSLPFEHRLLHGDTGLISALSIVIAPHHPHLNIGAYLGRITRSPQPQHIVSQLARICSDCTWIIALKKDCKWTHLPQHTDLFYCHTIGLSFSTMVKLTINYATLLKICRKTKLWSKHLTLASDQTISFKTFKTRMVPRAEVINGISENSNLNDEHAPSSTRN